MTVRVVKVIFCDEGRAGTGTMEDVVRRLPTLYTLDGQLICQYDCGAKEERPSTEQYVHGHTLSGLA